MKKLTCIIMTLLTAGYLHAQQYDCNCEVPDDTYEEFMRDQLLSVQYQNPIAWYRGEQYFNEWTGGEVSLTNGAVIRDMTLRYDMYTDELLWLRQMDNRTGVMTKDIVRGFELSGNRGQPMASFMKKNVAIFGLGTVDVYLQVLVEGEEVPGSGSGNTGSDRDVSKVWLYAYRNVVGVMNESRLRENTLYFIETKSGISPVYPRKNSLLNVPGLDREKMKELMRVNHIRLRNREGYMVEAVFMYNSEQ